MSPAVLRFTLCLILTYFGTCYPNADASTLSLHGSKNTINLQEETLSALQVMLGVYRAQYAPADWKYKFTQWNLDNEYQKAIKEVGNAQKSGTLTLQKSRDILKNFIYSMRDYHVSIRFFSTGTASLPFSVRSAEGRVFIAYIDRNKLSPISFPFNLGDELLEFEGRPVKDILKELEAEFVANVPETDQSMAENRLTQRRATQGSLVPQGLVRLKIQPKNASTPRTLQIAWETTQESVTFKSSAPSLRQSRSFKTRDGIIDPNLWIMLGGDHVNQDLSSFEDLNPFTTGTKRSFLPALGEKIWETDSSNSFDAYIYRTANRKMIGVIRIPTYSLPAAADYQKAVRDFSDIINHFEKHTDALFIDQLNNPGGSVFYLYTLASMLSPQSLRTPKHRMALIPQDIQNSVTNLKILNSVTDDESAQRVLGVNLHGYPVTFQTAQKVKAYYEFYLSQWNAGKTLTDPYHISGADELTPYPKGQYTKPITVLVNELCFSGGDFFPAILQDNKRATIIGVRTSGAGGYVRDVQWANLLGIERFRVTASLAERVDLSPIENLGVTPDVQIPLSAFDMQNNFLLYRQNIKAVVESSVK